MSDRWQEMTVFVRVADSGSLSRAARELKLSQPSVSRIIGMLEARLGTTLLLRTTRSLSLTDAGALYLERARRLLAEAEEAEQATRGLDSLHGVIRLAMPLMYGTRAIIPALAPFLARHPDLKVELAMSDARQNLITDGVDLAIRINVGPLNDSMRHTEIKAAPESGDGGGPVRIVDIPRALANHRKLAREVTERLALDTRRAAPGVCRDSHSPGA